MAKRSLEVLKIGVPDEKILGSKTMGELSCGVKNPTAFIVGIF